VRTAKAVAASLAELASIRSRIAALGQDVASVTVSAAKRRLLGLADQVERAIISVDSVATHGEAFVRAMRKDVVAKGQALLADIDKQQEQLQQQQKEQELCEAAMSTDTDTAADSEVKAEVDSAEAEVESMSESDNSSENEAEVEGETDSSRGSGGDQEMEG
jgi:hypothetical protein